LRGETPGPFQRGFVTGSRRSGLQTGPTCRAPPAPQLGAGVPARDRLGGRGERPIVPGWWSLRAAARRDRRRRPRSGPACSLRAADGRKRKRRMGDPLSWGARHRGWGNPAALLCSPSPTFFSVGKKGAKAMPTPVSPAPGPAFLLPGRLFFLWEAGRRPLRASDCPGTVTHAGRNL